MRRTARLVVLLVAALALLGPAAIPGAGRSMAAHGGSTQAEAILVETLAHGFPRDALGRGLRLERITLAPGAGLPARTDAGSSAVFVESGQLSLSIIAGFAEVTWGGQTTSQLIGSGEEVVLGRGDSLFAQRTVVHHAVNPGAAPAVLLAATLLTEGASGWQPIDDQGSPEPSWRPGQRP